MILTVRPRLSVQIHNRSSIRKVCDLKKNKQPNFRQRDLQRSLQKTELLRFCPAATLVYSSQDERFEGGKKK